MQTRRVFALTVTYTYVTQNTSKISVDVLLEYIHVCIIVYCKHLPVIWHIRMYMLYAYKVFKRLVVIYKKL